MKLLAATLTWATLVAAGASGVSTASKSSETGREGRYYAQARKIIYSVFPLQTAPAALRVASCETIGFTDFWNDSSHAKGLFQEMPGNDGRIFSWHGKSLRLKWSRISSTRPDYYAAQIALLQSHGGYDWGEWSCKPQ